MLHVEQYTEQSNAEDKHYPTNHYDTFCSKSFLFVIYLNIKRVQKTVEAPAYAGTKDIT